MRTTRPENDNWEFGFSRYVDRYGRPYPSDAFENDVTHYEGPDHMHLDEFKKKLIERIKKVHGVRHG
jgi:hypothetical protein